MQKAYFNSPIGVLEICGDESGVCELNFVREFICAEVTDANLKLCLSELESYFKGELKTFKTQLNTLHQAMVLFGRYTCKAVKPNCKECFLNELCSSKDKKFP